MYSAEDISSYADKLKDKSKENSYDVSSKELYEILSENVKDCKGIFNIIGCYLNFIHSKTDAVQFRYGFIALYAGCIAACIFNIFAAASKNRFLSIPYILLRFIEIAVIFTLHVNYMLYMKKNWNLGILILACCAGGFYILLLLYLWSVTIAMFQIIGIVNSKQYRAMIAKSKEPIVIVKKPRNQEVATIADNYDDRRDAKMVTSDFYGVHKQNFRRI